MKLTFCFCFPSGHWLVAFRNENKTILRNGAFPQYHLSNALNQSVATVSLNSWLNTFDKALNLTGNTSNQRFRISILTAFDQALKELFFRFLMKHLILWIICRALVMVRACLHYTKHLRITSHYSMRWLDSLLVLITIRILPLQIKLPRAVQIQSSK